MTTGDTGAPPPPDVSVDHALALRLLADQHPDLLELESHLEIAGWDNAIVRLGPDLAVRLPRRALAANLILHERRWLPLLAPHLPVAVPAPVRVGGPTDYYPYPWSIVPWFAGRTALQEPVLAAQAALLGEFLRRLHNLDLPYDPPQNPYRGGSLASRRNLSVAKLEAAAQTTLTAAEAAAALAVLKTAYASGLPPPVWLHGDLHAKNVITRSGRIRAIVDWGDICTGDRATDLAALWLLFDPASHGPFWEQYGVVDTATRLRAKAWAIEFGLMLHASHHRADPAFAAACIEAIRRALR